VATGTTQLNASEGISLMSATTAVPNNRRSCRLGLAIALGASQFTVPSDLANVEGDLSRLCWAMLWKGLLYEEGCGIELTKLALSWGLGSA
jgi:hypothetical protein